MTHLTDVTRTAHGHTRRYSHYVTADETPGRYRCPPRQPIPEEPVMATEDTTDYSGPIPILDFDHTHGRHYRNSHLNYRNALDAVFSYTAEDVNGVPLARAIGTLVGVVVGIAYNQGYADAKEDTHG